MTWQTKKEGIGYQETAWSVMRQTYAFQSYPFNLILSHGTNTIHANVDYTLSSIIDYSDDLSSVLFLESIDEFTSLYIRCLVRGNHPTNSSIKQTAGSPLAGMQSQNRLGKQPLEQIINWAARTCLALLVCLLAWTQHDQWLAHSSPGRQQAKHTRRHYRCKRRLSNQWPNARRDKKLNMVFTRFLSKLLPIKAYIIFDEEKLKDKNLFVWIYENVNNVRKTFPKGIFWFAVIYPSFVFFVSILNLNFPFFLPLQQLTRPPKNPFFPFHSL